MRVSDGPVGLGERAGGRGEARYWTGAIQVCRAAKTLHLPREPSRRPPLTKLHVRWVTQGGRSILSGSVRARRQDICAVARANSRM
jgi:hypothetical protein